MITKCANAECSAIFRYLHQGKLFLFEAGETAAPDPLNDLDGACKTRTLCHYWLCDACCRTMTVVLDDRKAVKVALASSLSAVAGRRGSVSHVATSY